MHVRRYGVVGEGKEEYHLNIVRIFYAVYLAFKK